MAAYRRFSAASCCVCIALWIQAAHAQALPSWNEGPAKQAILKFVADVTTPGSANLVPSEKRIAVFDNDGTLWAEQPMYIQVQFLLYQVKRAAPAHPEWKDNAVYKALQAHDHAALEALGLKPILQLLGTASSGMTTVQYEESIKEWLSTATDSRFNVPYTDMVYLPMLELLAYLRDRGFKNFIVSGGTIEFMRPWAEATYGIPPERVIGSITDVAFSIADNKPILTRLPNIAFVNDGPGKPVGIYRAIGRQPIFAFGNSDGDLQMLQWTQGGGGARFMGLVHHTDAKREWAYDRKSRIGKLDKALDAAAVNGWTVVDMQKDWSKVFSFQ
jgi:phosphoglycolate phosphatase-like HAD superfamily hydrolase